MFLSYADEFQRHQQWVQKHLSGRIDDNEDERPAPCLYWPTSFWTSAEKERFFHALTIHSRWRPDLIAGEVKTKTTVDVCAYIDALEKAALTGDTQLKREDMPIATEVSERWIRHEEDIAAELVAFGAHPQPIASTSTSTFAALAPPFSGDGEFSALDGHALAAMEAMVKEALSNEAEALLASGRTQRQRQTKTKTKTKTQDQEKDQDQDENEDLNQDENMIGDPTQIPDHSQTRTTEPMTEEQRKTLRRIQKRLYMRRKRAEAKGIVPNLEMNKLRPGRERRERPPPKGRPKTYKSRKGKEKEVLDDEEYEYDEEDIVEEKKGHSKGGLTRFYKAKKALAELGVDGDKLVEQHLDFFVLSSFGRLIRLFNSGDGDMAISSEVINILRVITMDFVGEAVRRSVVSREFENRLKGNTKCWKYDRREISEDNVKRALNSMDLRHVTKKDYFERLAESFMTDAADGLEDENEDDGLAHDDEGSEGAEPEGAEEDATENTGSKERDGQQSEKKHAHPRLGASVVHPSILRDAHQHAFPASIYTDPSSSKSTHLLEKYDLMPVDTDEEDLMLELDEEGALDKVDMKQSAAKEKELWKMDAVYEAQEISMQ